jgi:hypothetical protein
MQDPVVIESMRVTWTEGKSVGFIPSSIFIKDESADPQNEKPVYFLQEFGFGHPAWAAIDEHPFVEATPADYYDARNLFGRWDYIRHLPNFQSLTSEEHEKQIPAMFAYAGIEVRNEIEEPRLRLVPEWVSVVSHDEHLELLWKEKKDRMKADLQRRVSELCKLCAAGDKIYGDGYRFFHRKSFAFIACMADKEHGELKTKAWAMFSKLSVDHYQLLRGHIDRYSRLNSSRKLIRSHDAFRKLVNMGPEAIPFILNDLRKGKVGGIWGAEVLAEVTGKRGMDSEWWLSWAKQEGYEVGFEA